jgi:hypothetical protein
MPPILPVDWPQLYSIIITALVGAIFGAVGIAVKFHFDRKTAERALEEELERLEREEQYRQAEKDAQQKVEKELAIRQMLIKGLDDPAAELERLLKLEEQFRPTQAPLFRPYPAAKRRNWILYIVIAAVSIFLLALILTLIRLWYL